jgi:cell fate regulator YaaT (PSP1 superfamily)
VSHGKNGAFGRFVADLPLFLERGERVVVLSSRGLEVGSILCQANARHGQYLGQSPAGKLLRRVSADDDVALTELTDVSRKLFSESRELAAQFQLPVEILDVEVFLDRATAIIQFLGRADADFAPLVDGLAARHHVQIRLENLALPQEHQEMHGGCGKPDCGRVDGGGCSSCDSGGGCSSCGGGKVDMKAYFAHLRTRMEERQRTPLL